MAALSSASALVHARLLHCHYPKCNSIPTLDANWQGPRLPPCHTSLTEWSELEGTPRGCLVPLPAAHRDTQSSISAQSAVHPGLACLQRWDIRLTKFSFIQTPVLFNHNLDFEDFFLSDLTERTAVSCFVDFHGLVVLLSPSWCWRTPNSSEFCFFSPITSNLCCCL